MMTPREVEVADLLAFGMSNKQIGRQLRIAEGTVKSHVSAILRHYQVERRTAAAIAHVSRDQRRPAP